MHYIYIYIYIVDNLLVISGGIIIAFKSSAKHSCRSAETQSTVAFPTALVHTQKCFPEIIAYPTIESR